MPNKKSRERKRKSNLGRGKQFLETQSVGNHINVWSLRFLEQRANEESVCL